MEQIDHETMEALRVWRESRRPEALGELLKRQRDRAFAVALRMTGSSADAEDTVQEAFIKLLSRTHGFEDAESFEAAVYRAVVQCALDLLKSRKRRRSREQDFAEDPLGRPHVTEANAQVSETEREELRAAVRFAMLDLHEEERVPIVLCCQQGLTVSQAARVLEIPRETLRARLARALGSLRGRLGEKHRDAAPVLLPLLLWEEGGAAATRGLCERLDALLPGRTCGQLAARFRPARPDPSGWQAVHAAGRLAKALTAGGFAAALVVTMCCVSYRAGSSNVQASGGTQEIRETPTAVVRQEQVVRGADASTKDPKEEQDMKRVLSAMVLAGAAAMPITAQAGEPNADVAKVIKEVEARRAAKAEAEAKQAKEYQRREAQEGREGAWGNPGPGGSVRKVGQ